MLSSHALLGLATFLTLISNTSALSINRSLQRRNPVPTLPHDPNASSDCTWWYDNDGSIPCSDILRINYLEEADFIRLNPSIGAGCTNFNVGNSYCVEATWETGGEATTLPSSPTLPTSPTITTSSSSSTTPGIATPAPIQPGMVANCDAFYLVNSGDQCATIAASHGISEASFATWNPRIGSDCTGLWANVYVCVSVIGHEPDVKVPTPTPAEPSNGVTTPLPVQPGIVNNCDAFFLTKPGDSCDIISASHGISAAQFLAWNPNVGQSCTGMWSNVYVCVSVIRHEPGVETPTPTPTKPSNGVTTPLPVQPGIVNNCDAFYLTKSGDSCDIISASHGISATQFVAWNPNVGKSCAGMWSNVYVCVSIIGHTPVVPTSTAPSATTTMIDGTSYPRPAFQTQSPTTPKCLRWHKVLSTNTCLSIANYFGITVTQLKTWNQFININCSNLWVDQSICVSSPVENTYWWPVGCYTDSAARALTNRVSVPDEKTKMTPKLCQDACRAQGYSFAGIEFASQCFCDNAIRNGHTANAAGCTTPCPGKPTSHFCGGPDRLNVYRLDAYQDLGCYTDITENRSLKTKITGITGLTREKCQNKCEGAGLALSGVEAGVECYCDNKNTGTTATGCTTRCAGNQAEFCGGGLRVNVMKKPVSRSIGCWSDNDTPTLRSLKYQQTVLMAVTDMTPDLCRSTCRAAGFMFSGVEFGSDCWCDDKIHNGAATTGCNMPCPGNPSLMCGGALKLNIYES